MDAFATEVLTKCNMHEKSESIKRSSINLLQSYEILFLSTIRKRAICFK